MRNISFIVSLIFISITGIFTSCSEDYPGPDPVEVTANYSNKFSNPHPNLILNYEGEGMEGKAIDFSTVKGETATITLYDILPGEEALKITSIPLTGDAGGYSFSGNGTGITTGCTFNYDGRVEKGKLTIDLSHIKMANSELWARSYAMSMFSYGRGKDVVRNQETGLYEWGESDNTMLTSALYADMDLAMVNDAGSLYATVNSVIKGIGGYLLSQLLQNVTLEPNGDITAQYTTDEMQLGDQKFSEIDMKNEQSMQNVAMFIMMKVMSSGFTQDDITSAREGRHYVAAPKGLAYWYPKNGRFYVKLNIPTIITLVMETQGKTIDCKLMTTITDAILASNPIQLKKLLGKVNESINNSIIKELVEMDDAHFQSFFLWIKEGIPMHVEQNNGHTHIYLDREALSPIITFIPKLKPLLEGIPTFGTILYDSYLGPLYENWTIITQLNIGLNLIDNK